MGGVVDESTVDEAKAAIVAHDTSFGGGVAIEGALGYDAKSTVDEGTTTGGCVVEESRVGEFEVSVGGEG